MAKRKPRVDLPLVCYPLTAERWDDFEQLFGERGACGGCWCMTWRLTRSEFNQGKGAGNKAAMKALVESGESPGLIGYLREAPVGWVSVAPREQYIRLEKSRVLKPIDEMPVWSVSCLFVDKNHRKKGISVALLRAAVDYVRSKGGQVVEGYPVEPVMETMPAAFAWTGLVSAFLTAGFSEAARGSPSRPIMRYVLDSVK